MRRKCRCGKKPYDSKEAADRAIAANNSSAALFLLGWELKRSYKCPISSKWHVTSETEEEYEAAMKRKEENGGIRDIARLGD